MSSTINQPAGPDSALKGDLGADKSIDSARQPGSRHSNLRAEGDAQHHTTTIKRVPESGSALRSPKLSRESSPIRPQPRTAISTPASNSRPNRQGKELSPIRSATLAGTLASVPSAAAVQRALSANKPAILPTSFDGVLEGFRSDKVTKSGDSSPQWPVSPRLRSPPPATPSSRSSIPVLRKADSDTTPSNFTLKRFANSSAADTGGSNSQEETERDELLLHPNSRPQPRGVSANGPGLETVAEGSVPTTPAVDPVQNVFDDHQVHQRLGERTPKATDKDSAGLRENGVLHDDSGVRKGNADKGDGDAKAVTSAPHRPAATLAKRSYSSLAPTRTKPVSESMRTMTVETETVASVPQAPLNVNGERGTSSRLNSTSSVRPKPSSETIRPKKEKKKLSRKPASLHSGTASSKADIFEAKVASAIDETNSSDSDETFVYESNPPDRNFRRGHHSRTPSANSLASQIDQHGGRHKLMARDVSHGVAAKKSMKFTNSAYNNNLDGEMGHQGSVRSSTKNGSTTPRHHHIGRYGRGGHASLFDKDSPFTQANKPSTPRNLSTKLSKPGSPRIASGRMPGSQRKSDLYVYDVDEDGADDERTPLVGSVRISRNRHSRRPFSSNDRDPEYDELPQRSFCSRYGACIVVTLLLLVLCMGGAAFITALNKPLVEVSVKHIQNVLASEQEIMLDLDVRARNPNLFAITVNDLDVNVFAKSGYVGTAASWRNPSDHGSLRRGTRRKRPTTEGVFHVKEGVDEGTDPIEDPEGDAQTMLLGQIFDFDSPLVFEPSPLRRRLTSSVGEIRLAKPGNRTEEGGSARWERVLRHPFELIVRGVIKYQLPISSRMRSASVGSRVKVLPKDELEGNDTSTRTQVQL